MFNALKPVLFFASLLICFATHAQQFKFTMLSSSVPTNLRGLCPIDDKIIWTCGNNGHVGKTTDGGKTWQWILPKGYEKADFRDVYAFDAQRAVILATSRPALILRTSDGGKSWEEAFRSDDTLVFLDAIDFWNDAHGLSIGDWVNSKPYILETRDTGKTWMLDTKFVSDQEAPKTVASFAASGTCLRTLKYDGDIGFIAAVTYDGKNGLMLVSKDSAEEDEEDYYYEFYEANYTNTTAAQGIFSFCFDFENANIWVVGGDYSQPHVGYSAYFTEESDYFQSPTNEVTGYRSCVEQFNYNNSNWVIACGPNGADVTVADPKKGQWKNISQLPFNSCIKARNTNTVFLCGKQGTIYRMVVQ